MAPLAQTAPAKVNLTLKVLGRRQDGYHALVSLVAFARLGDRLELEPGEPTVLCVAGPFAAALSGEDDNLVLRAARMAARERPDWGGGTFRLLKRLPVAAGLGGGSANAAAALKLLARANEGRSAPLNLEALGARLGADIAVCLLGRAALMWGLGDKVRPAPALPPCPAVLVNPGTALATADVYAALAAPRAGAGDCDREPAMPGPFAHAKALAAHVGAQGNDLEPAALRLAPAIAEAKNALLAAQGCLAAQMSGSGPTCFGLFESVAAARDAARRIAAAHPGWWAVATRLR